MEQQVLKIWPSKIMAFQDITYMRETSNKFVSFAMKDDCILLLTES